MVGSEEDEGDVVDGRCLIGRCGSSTEYFSISVWVDIDYCDGEEELDDIAEEGPGGEDQLSVGDNPAEVFGLTVESECVVGGDDEVFLLFLLLSVVVICHKNFYLNNLYLLMKSQIPIINYVFIY